MRREYTQEEEIAYVLGARRNTVVTFPGTVWVATPRGNVFVNDSSHPRDEPLMVNVYLDNTCCGLLGEEVSDDVDQQRLVMQSGRDFDVSYNMMLRRGAYRLKSEHSQFRVPEELLIVEKDVDRFPIVGELEKYSWRGF